MSVLLFALLFLPAYAAVVPERLPLPPELPVLPDGVSYNVFVADLGYHTAIIVEQPRGWRLGPPGEETARYLEYAWGDRRFYRDSDFRPHALFATLVLPTASVLYLDGRSAPPQVPALYHRTVTARTVRALLAELERTVQREGDGTRGAPRDPVPGYGGRFHPAHGEYVWARDCNWWTVARLQAVGLAGSPTGVVVTAQVPGRLRGFAPQKVAH